MDRPGPDCPRRCVNGSGPVVAAREPRTRSRAVRLASLRVRMAGGPGGHLPRDDTRDRLARAYSTPFTTMESVRLFVERTRPRDGQRWRAGNAERRDRFSGRGIAN